MAWMEEKKYLLEAVNLVRHRCLWLQDFKAVEVAWQELPSQELPSQELPSQELPSHEQPRFKRYCHNCLEPNLIMSKM